MCFATRGKDRERDSGCHKTHTQSPSLWGSPLGERRFQAFHDVSGGEEVSFYLDLLFPDSPSTYSCLKYFLCKC